jgi:hypothetical protein
MTKYIPTLFPCPSPIISHEESPLDSCYLYWTYLEILARFDNIYELVICVEFESKFPLSFECKSETHMVRFWDWWKALIWIMMIEVWWWYWLWNWRLWSMLLRVSYFAFHLWLWVIAWGQASLSMGEFDVCQISMF